MEKNDKLLLKDIKEDLNKWRFFLMFMDNIRRLEDTIIKMSTLLNLICKSNEVQMKFPLIFFCFLELDKPILILMWKTSPALKKKKKKTPRRRRRAKTIVKRHNKGQGVEGTFHRRYEDLL